MSLNEKSFDILDDACGIGAYSRFAGETRRLDPVRVMVWGGLSCFVLLSWTAVVISLV